MAASLLASFGSDDIIKRLLIMTNLRNYEESAVWLAHNECDMKILRQLITEKRKSSPVFDTSRWIASMETAMELIVEEESLRTMHRHHVVLREPESGPLQTDRAN